MMDRLCVHCFPLQQKGIIFYAFVFLSSIACIIWGNRIFQTVRSPGSSAYMFFSCKRVWWHKKKTLNQITTIVWPDMFIGIWIRFLLHFPFYQFFSSKDNDRIHMINTRKGEFNCISIISFSGQASLSPLFPFQSVNHQLNWNFRNFPFITSFSNAHWHFQNIKMISFVYAT